MCVWILLPLGFTEGGRPLRLPPPVLAEEIAMGLTSGVTGHLGAPMRKQGVCNDLLHVALNRPNKTKQRRIAANHLADGVQ